MGAGPRRVCLPCNWHNGELSSLEGPEQTLSVRPWKLAAISPPPGAATGLSVDQALAAARNVARRSGFRARLTAIINCNDFGPSCATPRERPPWYDLPLSDALDGLTYVQAAFSSPKDPGKVVEVLALIDTGSPECDLRQTYLDQLGVSEPPFDHDAGLACTLVVSVMGRRTEVQVHRAEEPGDGDAVRKRSAVEGIGRLGAEAAGDTEKADEVDLLFGCNTSIDDAVIGYEALAQLGLLVDCRRRQLVDNTCFSPTMDSIPFMASGQKVPLEIANPLEPNRLRVVADALVDTASTDVDLSERKVRQIALEVDPAERTAQIHAGLGVKVQDNVGATDENPDAWESPDAAVLGHDALAALDLLVDCRGGRLLRSGDIPEQPPVSTPSPTSVCKPRF